MSEETHASMFLPYGDSYIQVVARGRDVDSLHSLGWVRSVDDLPANKPPVTVTGKTTGATAVVQFNGDKGCGRPGDPEWHMAKINEMESKDDVVNYLSELGLSIDKRGGLDKLKRKAIECING